MNACCNSAKKRLIACCDELLKVANENAVEYGDSVRLRIEELKAEISSHVFKVYLVGPFSCGKSSLLNRWLGSDVLTTGLAPETAVSSELRFGETERMILQPLKACVSGAHESDEELHGITEENMIRVRDLANQQKVANVILYMNNPKLKQYSDICLVDLPGLSSANPAHEAALLRFIQSTERIAVFCAPMTDGTIQGDAFEFMKKIFSYGGEPTLLLTKVDERPASDHEAIMNLVRTHLNEYGWDDVFVGKVSKDSIEDFEGLIRKYNEQKDDYILGWFGEKVRGVAEDMLIPLRRSLATKFDNSKIEEALEKIETTEAELPSLVREINREMTMSARNAVSDVMSKVRDSVMSQQGSLMAKAENGLDCTAEVASFIRSKLADEAPMAIEDAVSAAQDKAGELLDERLNFEFSDEQESIVPEVLPAEHAVSSYATPTTNTGSSFAESFKKGWGITETAFILGECLLPGPGGLIGGAIATAALMFFGSKDQSEDQSRKQAEFTMKLENVCKQTRPEVERTMMSAVEKCGQKLQLVVEEKIKNLHAQMNQLKQESDIGKSEWEARQAVRRAAQARIEAALSKAGIEEK